MESGLAGLDSFFTNHLGSALFLSVFLLGIGIGIGKLLLPALKELFGKGNVNVNVGEGNHSGRKICIPEECPDHKAEQQRSLRNEKQIQELWDQYGALRKELLAKLDGLEEGNKEILLALVESGKVEARNLRKRGKNII